MYYVIVNYKENVQPAFVVTLLSRDRTNHLKKYLIKSPWNSTAADHKLQASVKILKN